MERYSCLEQYEREGMKMAILKHEETFRQQVHELHRLYRVQKILMNDLKNEEMMKRSQRVPVQYSRREQERWNVANDTAASPQQEHPAAKECTREDEGEVDEESHLELTLAIGSSRTMRRKKKKEEASINASDSGASFSSSSAESNGGVKLLDHGHEWRPFHCERKSDYGVVEELRMREERVKHPPWLFQCLSLNMT